MLSPYQLENLTSLVNGVLVLLERKYRALPHLELWQRLFDMCLVDCHDEIMRHLWVRYEDSLTTDNTNPSTSTYDELSNSESHLARRRRQVTFTPDTVFENQRTSKEYMMFTKQQRRLLRQSTSTNLFGTIPFKMNNLRYAHLSSQSSRRVFIRPGNYS